MADEKRYSRGICTVFRSGSVAVMECKSEADAMCVVEIANEAYEAGMLPEEPLASPGYVDVPVYEDKEEVWFGRRWDDPSLLAKAITRADFMGFVYHDGKGKEARSGSPILWRDENGTLWVWADNAGPDAEGVRPDAVRLRVG